MADLLERTAKERLLQLLHYGEGGPLLPPTPERCWGKGPPASLESARMWFWTERQGRTWLGFRCGAVRPMQKKDSLGAQQFPFHDTEDFAFFE